MDMSQRIEDLIVITTRLNEVMQLENEAIKDHRFQLVAGLLEQKATLSRAYETRLKGMVDNSEQVEDVDEDLRERLHAVGTRMHALTEENARLLKISMKAHKSFIDAIAKAVKTSTGAPDTYAASGQASASIKSPGNRPKAVSFNETL